MTDYRLYWELGWDSRARLHVHRRGGGGGLWSELDLLHEPPVLDYCDAGALFRAAERFALADIRDLRDLLDEWGVRPGRVHARAGRDDAVWLMAVRGRVGVAAPMARLSVRHHLG